MATSLPEPLHQWVHSLLNNFIVASDHSHTHGEAQVWRLSAGGKEYFVKTHRREKKWEREVFAYEQWVPSLGAHNAPELVALYTEPHAILLTALPGIVMEETQLTMEQELEAWRKAGSVLAQLHAITNDLFGRPHRDGSLIDPEKSPVIFFKTSMEGWIARAESRRCLSADEIAFAHSVIDKADIFEGEVPTAIHGDYTPRNWMVDPLTGKWTGVFDFEHARWDLRVADFKRHRHRFFHQRPDLEEAFFTGYGIKPDERMKLQIRLMEVQQSLSGFVWALEHNETAFAQENRRILHHLMQSASALLVS